MTRIDPRPSENDQETDGAPLTRFTVGNGTRGRNAEPTALEKLAETERPCAAARRALRILETAGLAPITAALRCAALKPQEGQPSPPHRTVGFGRGAPLREDARCPT